MVKKGDLKGIGWMIVLLGLLVLMLSGCSQEEPQQVESQVPPNEEEAGDEDDAAEGEVITGDEGELYGEIIVEVDLQNEQSDEYYLFFVNPGTLGTDGEATGIFDFYGPVEVENFQSEVELLFNSKITDLLDQRTEKRLQLVVTTREDFLIRNPLNEEMFIDFDVDEEWPGTYLSTQEKFVIPIVDEYPEGVISLPWPEADFVVALDFDEGVEPRESYIIKLRKSIEATDSASPGAPINRRIHYYNTPYYAEQLKGFVGVLEIEGEQGSRIKYEGEPLTLKFDEEGRHIGDAVVRVLILE